MFAHAVPYVHVINNPAQAKAVVYGPRSQTNFWLLATKKKIAFVLNLENTTQEERFHNVFHLERTPPSELVKVKGQLLNKHQKSLTLLTEFVNRYTVPQDWICDPFMGAGSTGVAALKLRRYFLGADCDPRMVPGVRQRFHHEGFKEYLWEMFFICQGYVMCFEFWILNVFCLFQGYVSSNLFCLFVSRVWNDVNSSLFGIKTFWILYVSSEINLFLTPSILPYLLLLANWIPRASNEALNSFTHIMQLKFWLRIMQHCSNSSWDETSWEPWSTLGFEKSIKCPNLELVWRSFWWLMFK